MSTVELLTGIKAKRVRVTRTLVYEGPVSWLTVTFSHGLLRFAGDRFDLFGEERTIYVADEKIEVIE